MQDDTWINQNMDALYLNMIRYPALIHANSPPTLYLDQARRRFYNSGMHIGYCFFKRDSTNEQLLC